MDSSWLTAIVGVLGIAATLTLALLSRRDSARREKRQFDREDQRDAADRVRSRRELERESVMKLSDIFANARSLAERPVEEDPPGMDWEDDFAHSWELSYYSAMRESELVSDREFREVFQECIQAIISSWIVSSVPGAGGARRFARDTAALGFVATGCWLRDEKLDTDTRERFKAVQSMTKEAEQILEETSLKSPGEEPA